MKIAFFVLSILIVASFFLLFNFRGNSNAAEAPGLVDGTLSKCPDKPNCVCSEQKNDANHYIDPIIIPQDATPDIFSILKTTIHEMGGTIKVESDNYLAATFTSAIFRFVDDLELRIDLPLKIIHIRSASRVGYSDMGVNRRRTELLKKLFDHKVSETNKPRTASPKNDGM